MRLGEVSVASEEDSSEESDVTSEEEVFSEAEEEALSDTDEESSGVFSDVVCWVSVDGTLLEAGTLVPPHEVRASNTAAGSK